MAIVAGCAAVPTRYLCHVYASPDWLTLVVTTLASASSVGGLFLWQPKKIVGIYGTDAVVMIFESIPSRFVPRVALHWFNTRIVGGTV